MYKLVRRYFGELCDTYDEDSDNEVFDEEIVCENKNFPYIYDEFQKYVKQDIRKGYVVDEENQDYDVLKGVILFGGCQENWNNYIEMFIKVTADEDKAISEDINKLVKKYDSLTKGQIRDELIKICDKYEKNYRQVKEELIKKVVKRKIKNYNGSRVINNNNFVEFIKDLQKTFEVEIDLVDLEVRFI